MAAESDHRIDSASKVIKASPRSIYQAHMDPDALVAWLPPRGMKAHLDAYDPREGGTYRMVLTYDQPAHSVPGKASPHADIVRGRFLKLVPNERIVQLVEFESEDPAFAGEMTLTWTLTAVPGGTNVAIRCENVPAGIRHEDHEAGFRSTLENLAVFVEGLAGARAIDITGPPNAPSIVLVHGSVVTRKVWGPQMRGLSDTFKMIAPDLPGHGEMADTPFGFDSAIERLADVVRQHADGRAVVVGLSLGGYIAIECAVRRPDSVRGLVLAGTTVNFTGLLGYYLKAVSSLMRRGWLLPGRASMEKKTRALFSNDLAADADAQLAAGVFPKPLAPAFAAMAGRDFAERLSQYAGPTLILNGSRDKRASRGAPQFAAAARKARIETIPDAGHACSLDQPDAFNRAVRRFASDLEP